MVWGKHFGLVIIPLAVLQDLDSLFTRLEYDSLRGLRFGSMQEELELVLLVD